MMAAGRAAFLGKRVLLLEKNKKLGEKLAISGGGRCNITNATYDIHALLAHYGAASQFLFSPFSQFGVRDTFSFFELFGLPLIVQANNRAFPRTQKATDVVKVLLAYVKSVEVKMGSPVEKILHENSVISGIISNGKTYTAKNYILATGGVSHPETGSTGDGFGWLRDLGHTVKSPTPTIVPLKTSDTWSHSIPGVTAESVKISFYVDGVKSFSKIGNILFTHFGLSGPLILNSASKMGDLLKEGEVTANIDLFPTINIGQLDEKNISIFAENKNKLLKNVLKEIVAGGIAAGIVLLLDEELLEAKVQGITKDQRKKLTHLLKGLPVHVTNLMGFDKAVIADGGVPLEEIDMKTMRSKKVSNLFVTGDLLHINRPSGGYSLQLCWTTGFVAGSNS